MCWYSEQNSSGSSVRKRAIGSFDSNIIANDKTLSQGGNDLADFKAIKRDLLYGENFSKISNNLPLVSTETSVVRKHYDVNTSSEIRSIQDMQLIEILEELQNSNENISSDSSCDGTPNKKRKGSFCSDICAISKEKWMSQNWEETLKSSGDIGE